MEIWKDIEGFEFYQVSNFGRIRSLQRTFQRDNPKHAGFKQNITVGKNKIISGWERKSKTGRLVKVCVALRKESKTYQESVHKLVLGAFVGPRPEGMECCHNDGNPANNNLDNLRWDTHEANVHDSVLHNTKTAPPVHIGEMHPNSKLSEQAVVEIRSMPYKFGLFANISRKYKISANHASRIWKGQGWDRPQNQSLTN